jgi:HD domain
VPVSPVASGHESRKTGAGWVHLPHCAPHWSTLRSRLPLLTRLDEQEDVTAHRPAMLAVPVVAAFIVLTGLHAGDSAAWTAFDNIGEALAAVLATVACAIRASRERSLHASALETQREGFANASATGPQRRSLIAWSLLTVGVGAWALGQIGWTVYETGLGIEPVAPSPLDGLFLLFSVLTICGLLAMVRTPAGYLSQLRGAVEGLFIASGFFLCSWSLVIGSVIAHRHALTLGGLTNLAYPVLDTVALAAVFFVILRRRHSPSAGLGLLALGLICVAASDSWYWYLTESQPAFPGVSPLDAGWVAGFLAIAIAALWSGKPRRWEQRLASGRLTLALPALPATVGVLTVLAGWRLSGTVASEGALLGIMAVVLMLGVGLLVIVTYENHALSTDLERRVEERTRELVDARAETLQRLAGAAEYHDGDTFQHTERVGVTAAEIASRLGLPTDQIGLLREAAPLHDVGKLAISDTILLKAGKLSAEEYEVMKTHAELGARLLSGSSSPVLQMATVIAASHHERWDGAGYPAGLVGRAIPWVGRIVAVADVFDALTHDRPYKAAWPVAQAIAEIEGAAGSQLDPDVVAAFLGMHSDTAVASENSARQRPRMVRTPRRRGRPTSPTAGRVA